MSVHSTSLAPMGGAASLTVGKTTRELLDAARACESTDIASARSMAQHARVLSHTQGDVATESEALYRLASIAYASNQADDAFAIALDAREQARQAGAVVVEVWALNLVGIVHYNAGNFSEALGCALQAVELYRSTDHEVDEGNLLNTVAIIHHSLGDTDRALVTYEAALTANKGYDRFDNDAITLANMAEVRAGRNENFLAVSLAEEALELSREHAPTFVPEILARLGESYCALELLDRADECLAEGREVLAARTAAAVDQNVPTESLLALMMAQGKVDVARGNHDAAAETYTSALHLAQQIGKDGKPMKPEVVLRAHTELSRVFKQLGRFEEALFHQESRFSMHEELFNGATDLRIKTLQIAHDTEAARQQAEILRLRTGELEVMVRNRTNELEEYQLEAFQRLAVLAEFRDTDTGEHTIRVGDLAADVAEELGEPKPWVKQLRLAARLHDIGKVAVPDSILLKPGPLTPAEFDVMKTHTTVGAEILAGSSSPLIQLASTVALHHHERWDGSGYPHGLRGADIPIGGRIVTVADVFDALTSHRSYKHAWTPLEAIQFIRSAIGTQFEPRVVDAFLRVMARRLPDLAPQFALSAT